jgi:hypothetical protein
VGGIEFCGIAQGEVSPKSGMDLVGLIIGRRMKLDREQSF